MLKLTYFLGCWPSYLTNKVHTTNIFINIDKKECFEMFTCVITGLCPLPQISCQNYILSHYNVLFEWSFEYTEKHFTSAERK